MSPTILIIDDDEKLNLLLKDFFKDFGLRTIAASHPEAGLKLLQQQSPDIVILDIMLPDMNGFEVCKAIRRTSTVPIIMLTAKGDLMDRVVGLELGADDYLAKPFEPRELVARIQSVLRRARPAEAKPTARFANMVIDHNLVSVRCANHVTHVPQLGPGAGIKNQDAVRRDIVCLDIVIKDLNVACRIEKLQRGRRAVGVDDSHFLSDRAQHFSHPQLTAQRVTIRSNVADQHEGLVMADLIDKGFPLNAHKVGFPDFATHASPRA